MLSYVAGFQDVFITEDRVTVGNRQFQLAGATAGIDTEAADPGRVTVTRWALIGPFALAAKKGRRKGQTFLTVEGPGWGFVRVAEGQDGVKARAFAAKFNAQASAAAAAAARVAEEEAAWRAAHPAPAPVRTRTAARDLPAMAWPE